MKEVKVTKIKNRFRLIHPIAIATSSRLLMEKDGSPIKMIILITIFNNKIMSKEIGLIQSYRFLWKRITSPNLDP
jgi:hypothetical protein